MGTPRSMGAATVTLGLVTVPVRIFAAAESAGGVAFNLLHRKCGSRVKQNYVCSKCAVVITKDDMVKGHEFEKDRYVTFTEEEIKALAEAASPGIEIAELVSLDKVDPVFFDGAYYLAPDKGGERAYALLAAALRQSKLCALARWSARGKGYLVLLRPASRGIVMQVLHYASEVRSIDEVIGAAAAEPVSDSELKLALQLMKRIAVGVFRPEAYSDQVRARMEAAIARKVKGDTIVVAPPPGAPRPTKDLVEALKASLNSKPAKRSAGRRRAA